MEEPWLGLVRGYLRARRQVLEPNTTIGTYRHVLTTMAAYLDDNDVDRHADMNDLAVLVADWVHSRRWAASTRCTNLGIIRPFFDWAARRGLVTAGVSAELVNPRRPDPIPRALSVAQVARLLTAVPDRRGRVIVQLEFQCGLRRAEVARLDLDDLDLAGGSLLVHGKGRVQRVVYPSNDTMDAIRLWLLERGPGAGALICAYNEPGRRLTPTWIGIMVTRWLADAGIKARAGDGVSGHALRHSCATTMLRNGGNIAVVQRAMGHRSIQTTARYLRADDDEVRDAMTGVSAGRRLTAVEDAG